MHFYTLTLVRKKNQSKNQAVSKFYIFDANYKKDHLTDIG